MVPIYTSFLKKCAINTPIDMGTESSEWIKAWFSCLNHSYHMATRKLIEDCFINGRSSRSNIGKEVFFKEIHNAARMFRLKLIVKCKNGKIVCHVPKFIQRCAISSSYYPVTVLVDIELIKPENHVLKTIDFSSHVLIKCPCKSHESERERMFIEECLQKRKKRLQKRIRKKEKRLERHVVMIQKLFRMYLAQKKANILRCIPENLFDNEFGKKRRQQLINEELWNRDNSRI